jgi:hypothetical protein
MKGFILSLQSEFYKSRKTLGFWSAILLPLILMFLVSVGFYLNYGKLMKMPSEMLWGQFAGIAMGLMGTLLLPMFIIFLAYSVNNIEHKSDTWKTLFTLPIPKWSVYSAKYVYTVFLLLLSLVLFATLTIGFGNLLGVIQPKLKFSGYHMEGELFQVYAKFIRHPVYTICDEPYLERLFKTDGHWLFRYYSRNYTGNRRSLGICLRFPVLAAATFDNGDV